MLDVEEKKLEMEGKKIEAANQRHGELMMTLQQQQHQMETFQAMMIQQQQRMNMQQTQQNELMLKLFGMLNNK
jgi:competence transcription factor ComK